MKKQMLVNPDEIIAFINGHMLAEQCPNLNQMAQKTHIKESTLRRWRMEGVSGKARFDYVLEAFRYFSTYKG